MLDLLTLFLKVAGLLGLAIALGTALLWWAYRPS